MANVSGRKVFPKAGVPAIVKWHGLDIIILGNESQRFGSIDW
jgi:hypothetical protein